MAQLGAWLDAAAWLPFSRGGHESWSQRRELSAVARVLGAQPVTLGFSAGRVFALVRHKEGDGIVEETLQWPCEALRGPLKLPACPESARISDAVVAFAGHGQGHGEGLDVEAMKSLGISAEAMLERSYRKR